ncbi:hypothetical protein HanRHA438_Chr05g0217051 [Helianthus annuus]|nr:hypothetical protein HanRHA438_Chr15g0716701 [Helianthus annuus]KAJ0918362.1 hypothetical protein HanRHA438_Chr05g0217051 [Helianthus annuus]
MLSDVLYLFVHSFNIRSSLYILLDCSKFTNPRNTQTRRLHQNRRETHNLVNDSQSIYFSFYMKFTIKLGVKSSP